ncbi:MAG: glycosyltransferase family 2 protein [Varibaculum cambriense]|nr:glycosyltransferase family 2 protein [Varibaculum cambriense]
MRVAAVVVTYNRRDLLEKTLQGLENQTRPVDRIFVIDNASTDDTSAFLSERVMHRPTTVIKLPINTGGAGGFYYGIETAYEKGFDAFWLMDDDTVPRKDALSELLRGTEGEAAENGGNLPSFACSMVIWKDGSLCEMNTPETTWDWPRRMAKGQDWQLVKSCSFVSCLVTREAARKVGLPYREYFIWADDAEYTSRLAKWRPGVFVPSSIVDHLLAKNRGVNWGDATSDSMWKFGRGARNQVSAAISLRSLVMLTSLVENMLKQLHNSNVPVKVKLQLVMHALSGFFFHPRKRFPRAVR